MFLVKDGEGSIWPVVGIDQSWSCTAVHHAYGGQLIKTKPKNYPNSIHRLDDILKQIQKIVSGKPGHAFVEGYSMASKGMVFQLGELGGAIRLMLFHMGWTVYIVSPKTLKKFTTLNGNADKEMMKEWVKRCYGYESVDDNDADAYALRAFGVTMLHYEGGMEPPKPFHVPSDKQIDCFEGVEIIRPRS